MPSAQVVSLTTQSEGRRPAHLALIIRKLQVLNERDLYKIDLWIDHLQHRRAAAVERRLTDLSAFVRLRAGEP